METSLKLFLFQVCLLFLILLFVCLFLCLCTIRTAGRATVEGGGRGGGVVRKKYKDIKYKSFTPKNTKKPRFVEIHRDVIDDKTLFYTKESTMIIVQTRFIQKKN